MTIDRRSFLYAGGLTAAAAPLATGVHAAPAPGGRSATDFGIIPNSETDQTSVLQKALDELARSGHPLHLPAGVYVTGPLTLRKACTIVGAPGQTTLRATSPGALLAGDGLSALHLSGLVFEGPETKAKFLLLFVANTSVNIENCRFVGAAAPAIRLENCSGRVAAIEVTGAATGVLATGAAGLAIIGCRMTSCHGIGISVSSGGNFEGFTVSQNHLGSCFTGILAEGVGVVSGNILARSANFGLKLGAAKGSGHILAQNNLIRDCRIGIAVSSSGDDIMASLNMITGAKDGAIRAFDGEKLVGPDLARQSAEAYLNLMVAGNVVR